MTWPNTTCLPSRWGQGISVMKNCEDPVSRPQLAMDSIPGSVCCGHNGNGSGWSRGRCAGRSNVMTPNVP